MRMRGWKAEKKKKRKRKSWGFARVCVALHAFWLVLVQGTFTLVRMCIYNKTNPYFHIKSIETQTMNWNQQILISNKFAMKCTSRCRLGLCSGHVSLRPKLKTKPKKNQWSEETDGRIWMWRWRRRWQSICERGEFGTRLATNSTRLTKEEIACIIHNNGSSIFHIHNGWVFGREKASRITLVCRVENEAIVADDGVGDCLGCLLLQPHNHFPYFRIFFEGCLHETNTRPTIHRRMNVYMLLHPHTHLYCDSS